MVMSVTEASAAQDVLRVAASSIHSLRSVGWPGDRAVLVDEYGTELTLEQAIAAGRVLAEQSYKKLHAGIDGRMWDNLTEPGGDDHG